MNLNEHGSESGVTAPQAQNFAFLGHKVVKNLFVLLPFPFYQAPAVTFVWRFGGQNYSLGVMRGRHGPVVSWIRLC